MKTFILIAIGWMTFSLSHAQEARNAEAQKKIQAARIALITERLGLSPEQAEKFWPVYKEFSQKRQEARVEFLRAKRRHDPKTATEVENQRLVQMGLEVKQRELNLEKEYSERLLRVIDTRQLVSLKKAEDDFRQMILRRIEQQRNLQDRRQQLRDRNQNQLDRRRGGG